MTTIENTDSDSSSNPAPRPYYVTWSKQKGAATLAVIGAEGDQYLTADGRRIYDGISTSFQASFGHSHALIRQRIVEQLSRLPIASPKMDFELKDRVSQRLLQRLGLGAGRLFYTVSGAESVENALKMARQITGRPKILARIRSYHGASLGAMSVSGDWRSDAHLTFAEGTVRMPEPYDDQDLKKTSEVFEQHAGSLAAVILETISGTNGVIIASPSWWEGIAGLCREHGVMLIIDEVLCGFGRTGPDFAFQQYSLRPDMVCMSKAITGGYVPMGAVWTAPSIAEFYDDSPLVCGLTNYAHPLGLAALSAVLDILEDAEFAKRKAEVERQFSSSLERIARDQGAELRRAGLLAAIEWQHRNAPTAQQMLDRNVYAFSKDRMLILAPPLTSKAEHLGEALQAIEDVLH